MFFQFEIVKRQKTTKFEDDELPTAQFQLHWKIFLNIKRKQEKKMLNQTPGTNHKDQ